MLRVFRACAMLLVLLLTACGPSPAAQTTPALSPLPTAKTAPSSPLPTPLTSPLPAGKPILSPPGQSRAAELAQADLARRLNIAPDQIAVVSVVESGQPAANETCQPVGTLGPNVPVGATDQSITLAAAGQLFAYRTQGGRLMSCEKTTATPGADAAVKAAINDLVAKLKVAPETVQVVSVTDVDWSDTSLGCPQPGMFYAQVIVPGYKMTLSVGGQRFEYHADRRGRVILCNR